MSLHMGGRDVGRVAIDADRFGRLFVSIKGPNVRYNQARSLCLDVDILKAVRVTLAREAAGEVE